MTIAARYARPGCAALGAFALATGALAQPSRPTEVRVGNEPWRLSIALGDLKPAKGAESTTDRKVYTYANDRGVMLSVMVENAHAPAVMASCRDVFDRRARERVVGASPVNEVQGVRGDAATQDYDLKVDFRGETIVMHNAFTCRIRGDWYIDAHVSKIPYEPGDHDALVAILDAVAIVE